MTLDDENPLDELIVLTWRMPNVPTDEFECLSRMIEHDKEQIMESLCSSVKEQSMFFLHTCQRIIIAFLPRNRDSCEILNHLGHDDQLANLVKKVEILEGEKGFFHLAEVASSLHSLVLGEPQVLGQVKEARDLLTKQGHLKGALKLIIDHVIRTAALIMSTTEIPRGKISTISLLEYRIKKFLRQRLNGQRKPSVGIFGTGEMARQTFNLINRVGIPIEVTWYTHREDLLRSEEQIAGHPIKNVMEFLFDPTPHDLLILATTHEFPFFDDDLAAKFIANYKKVEHHQDRPLIIDVGMPRCSLSTVKKRKDLELIQIDDLFQEIRKGQKKRETARKKAEILIHQQVIGLRKKLLFYRERHKIQDLRAEMFSKWQSRRKQLMKLLSRTDVDLQKVDLIVERIMKDFIHVSLMHIKQLLWEVDENNSRRR